MIYLKARRLFCLAAVAALGAGCAEKQVRLEYRFPADYSGHYRWSIRAVTFTESPTEQTTSRLEAVLLMDETVRREPDGRMILAVRLDPLTVKENGQAGAVPPPSTAEYEIDRRGSIRKLIKADLSSGAISSLELDALASQIRPPLSSSPEPRGGTWNAPLKISGERTSIDFRGAGRLLGFDLRDRRRLGRIETERRGSIVSNQLLNNANVVLKGRSSSRGLSTLDLDRGILFSSSDRSTSHFDVSFAGRPAAKVTVRLFSRLQLEPQEARAGSRRL